MCACRQMRIYGAQLVGPLSVMQKALGFIHGTGQSRCGGEHLQSQHSGGKWRQEEQNFKVILMASTKPARDTRDPVSGRKRKCAHVCPQVHAHRETHVDTDPDSCLEQATCLSLHEQAFPLLQGLGLLGPTVLPSHKAHSAFSPFLLVPAAALSGGQFCRPLGSPQLLDLCPASSSSVTNASQ